MGKGNSRERGKKGRGRTTKRSEEEDEEPAEPSEEAPASSEWRLAWEVVAFQEAAAFGALSDLLLCLQRVGGPEGPDDGRPLVAGAIPLPRKVLLKGEPSEAMALARAVLIDRGYRLDPGRGGDGEPLLEGILSVEEGAGALVIHRVQVFDAASLGPMDTDGGALRLVVGGGPGARWCDEVLQVGVPELVDLRRLLLTLLGGARVDLDHLASLLLGLDRYEVIGMVRRLVTAGLARERGTIGDDLSWLELDPEEVERLLGLTLGPRDDGTPPAPGVASPVGTLGAVLEPPSRLQDQLYLMALSEEPERFPALLKLLAEGRALGDRRWESLLGRYSFVLLEPPEERDIRLLQARGTLERFQRLKGE